MAYETAKSTVSGGVGGSFLVVAGHPLDTLKVRLQTQKPVNGVMPYKGTIDCVKKTFKAEGVRGFYKGMLGPLVGVTPVYALVFFGYGVGQRIFTNEDTYQNMSVKNLALIGAAGAVSGIFSTPVMTPLERVKCIMQIQTAPGFVAPKGQKIYGGIMECLKDTYKQGGITNLCRGFWATMARDCTASVFYFSTYSFLRFHLNPKDGTPPGIAATIFAGGMAGVMNWAGCLPIDTLKSRYQTAPMGTYPNGIRSVFTTMVKNEGFGALYKGAAPIFMRAFPANAACFLGAELTLRVFGFFEKKD